LFGSNQLYEIMHTISSSLNISYKLIQKVVSSFVVIIVNIEFINIYYLKLFFPWPGMVLIKHFCWSTGHNGTIDGQGQTWWKKYRQKLLNHTRGPLVQIMWSSDIVFMNITLRNSPFWTLHPYDCKNVTIRNVTILAPIFEAPNTDGIDPGKYFWQL
jgi:hypothetical protein